MSCNRCCSVEQQFDRTAAERALRRYRRRGPDKTTRRLIEDLLAALLARGVHDAVLLDIGAGVGAIHHELLDGAVSRAVHVDASPAQVDVARAESERRGHGARVEFVQADFTTVADDVAVADIVTLDRVICCYNDMAGLVSRSAVKAAMFYGAVYPRQTPWTRLGVSTINLFQRVRRSAFRVFLHHPSLIDLALRDAGLERVSFHQTLGWEIVVYARRAVRGSPTATA